MRSRRTANSARNAAPAPVTASYLRRAAMHYLSGRAASGDMVRCVLERRVLRRLQVRELDAATRRLVDDVVAELSELTLIDDARFAESRASALAGRGLSRSRITRALREKGIAPEAIPEALGVELDDLAQARRFVARKRLGPLRPGGMTVATRRKDLAALARAGFAYGVASRALDEPDER